jgi:hypothetical protein
VNRIDRWTRQLLEQEARKRGVREPELQSRADLMRAIIAHDYNLPRGLRNARKLVGTLFDTAAAVLPALARSAEEFAANGGKRHEPNWTAREKSAADAAAVRDANATLEDTRPVRPIIPRERATTGRNEADDASRGRDDLAQAKRDDASRGRDDLAQAKRDDASRGRDDLAQAKRDDAAVRGQRTADPSARADRTGARAQSAAPLRGDRIAPSVPQPAFAAFSDVASEPAAADSGMLAGLEARVAPTLQRARELHLRWRVAEGAAKPARDLLGATGELAIRVVCVRPDPTGVVCSEVTEHGPIELAGEWTLQLASADTHCVSAIGVRSGKRFVSIVHERTRTNDD